MPNTIIADTIGQKNIGYVLLKLLSRNAQRQVRELLLDLDSELPGVLWTMPENQLHSTLCEIIQPKEYAQDKDALFKLHEDDYRHAPKTVLSKYHKFTVHFDTIEASQHAIIIKSSNSNVFNAIRSDLVTSIYLPDGTRTPPDITHCSIARYTQEVDLETVQKVVAKHTVDIREEMDEFVLLRSEISPLQKYKIIEIFTLS